MASILVTGVGAIIGYGVLRSLKDSGHQLIGMDIYADAYGQHLCSKFVQAVPTSDATYPAFLDETLRSHRPDLVLPCIEQDVERFDQLRDLFMTHGAACCLNRSALIRLASDKWQFHQAELAQGLEPIASTLSPDFDELVAQLGLPFLLKPRRGYAGKGIVEIESEDAFLPHRVRMGLHYMAQRLIGSNAEEYTAAIFGDGDGGFYSQIQMRRLLSREGATQKAWVVNEATLADRLRVYAAAFKPLGPTNLQFRRDGNRWVLLEINPRISSASSLRAAFGYNEALQAVTYYLEGRPPTQPRIRGGRAIRYIEDFVVYDDRTYF